MSGNLENRLRAVYRGIREGRLSRPEAEAAIAALRAEAACELRLCQGEPYLRDHTISGEEVVIGVTYAALAARCFLASHGEARAVRLRRLLFLDPVAVPPAGVACLHAALEGGACAVAASIGGEEDLRNVATCLVEAAEPPEASAHGADENAALRPIAPEDLYRANPHVTWGPAFRLIGEAAASAGHARVEIVIPPEAPPLAAGSAFDPRILNGVLFAAFAIMTLRGQACALLPLSAGSITAAAGAASGPFRVEARLSRLSAELLTVDAAIFDGGGRCVGVWHDFGLKRMARAVHAPANPLTSLAPSPAAPGSGDTIRAFLGGAIARVLGHAVEDGSRNLLDLGMDSRGLVALAGAIGHDLSIDLMPTLFFEYPSLDELAAHFAAHHADAVNRHMKQARAAVASPPQAAVTAAARPALPARQTADMPIAIIGMAGRLAGSDDLDAFWRNMAAEHAFITEVPPGRWKTAEWFDTDRNAPNKTYCKWGSFIDGIAEFDPLFFNISPQQAQWLDPQVRHLLEAVYHAAEDAGAARALRGSRTGVYAGVCFQEYWDEIIRNGIAQTGHEHPSSYRSSIAAHISYALDLRGPSLPIDSACASSLSALHLACQAIRAGECDMAFACGTNLLISPLQFVYFSRIQAMSPSGRCHTFDARADGFVPGEGAIALLLKPLEQAERDGDPIHAVVRGSAINHTGRSPNPTAPRPELQTEVLRTAWQRAGISPAELSYLECHGTGTSLGDPIEINALRKAFGEGGEAPEGHCVIGSVKAHIGHLEGAAGLAGVVNIVKSMQHATLLRMPEFGEINPMIRLEGSPFRILRGTEAWAAPSGRRIAGVSGFGMTGNGAHAVIESYDIPQRDATAEHGPQLIVLSARDDARLRETAARLRGWLEGAGQDAWLPDIAHTLQTGREALEHRLAFIASSRAELCQALAACSSGRPFPGLNTARVSRAGSSTMTEDPPARGGDEDLAQYAAAWLAGRTVAWRDLAARVTPAPRRISLPGYAFAREAYWFSTPAISSPSAPKPAADITGLSLAPVWQEKPDRTDAALTPSRALLIAPRAALSFAHALAARCGQSTIVVAEDCATPEALAAALPPLSGVDALFFLAGAGADEGLASPAQLAAAQSLNELLALRVFQALGRARGVNDRTDVFVLLADCFPTTAAPHHPAGAGVCGLAYALAQGDARFRVRNIDLGVAAFAAMAGEREHAVSAILREPAAPRGDLVRHEAGRRYRRSFSAASLPEPAAPGFRRGGVYVIAGGGGAVGKVITRWLLSTWDARVVWLGRSAETAMSAALQDLAGAGGVLEYIRADVTDPAQMARAVETIRARHGTINGAVYAPVVFSFANGVMETDEAEFRSILDVKTRGSLVFANALHGENLDFLCFFSSSQSFAFSGAARLSAYAAGICFADSFAASLAASAAYPVGVINWGFWRAFTQTPLWRQYQAEHPQAASAGHIGFLEDDEGIACFARFVGNLRQGGARRIACLRQSEAVAALIRQSAEDPVAETTPQAVLPDNPQALRATLAALLAEVLRLPPGRLEDEVPFAEYGIDSIASAAYVSRINAALGCAMSATALYDHPTLAALASHLAPALAKAALQAPAAAPAPTQTRAAAPTPPDGAIAVIGMSLEVPGARTPAEFWDLLCAGRGSLGPVPASRLQGAAPVAGLPPRVGILERRDFFDPLFFHISPREAEEMSPYQRIALQEAWRCIEDGGYNPKSLAATPTGVFIGAEPASFARASLTGGSDALIAARVSYFLNLQGPALVVNTGCSSSGVALHLACESLRRGETRMALAGGVFADIGSESLRLLAGIGMLSPRGVCCPFDADADGTVLAEGAGMVLLKPLRDALADGDPVRGVILATAMNQDGASNGITAPNGRSQEALLRQVYGPGKLDAASISYVEAHGTGTSLGDPIEVNALSRVFATAGDGRVPEGARLGSLKATIGHTSAASGVIGLIKLMLALGAGSIPGVPGFSRLNPRITDAGWAISPSNAAWTARPGRQRRAALNCFGHSGTNVHAVVEEAGPGLSSASASTGTAAWHLVPLSARGPDQLRQQAQELLGHLAAPEAAAFTPAAVAWTLQSGRMEGKERVIFHVPDIAALRQELTDFLAGAPSSRRWQGVAGATAEAAASGDDLPALARCWAAGGTVPWERLHSVPPRRLNLPASAFAQTAFPVQAFAAAPEHQAVPAVPESAAPPPAAEDLLRLAVWQAEALPDPIAALTPGRAAIFCTAAARPLAAALQAREAALGSAVSIHDLATAEGLREPVQRAYVLPWAGPGAEALADGSLEALALRQVLAIRRMLSNGTDADLFMVTRHATPAPGQPQADAPPLHVAGAGAAGLAYALAQGDHRLRVRNIDVAADDPAALAAAIMQEPACHRGTRIRLEADRRLVLGFPRLAAAQAGEVPAFRTGGTYVIAGGAGTVGGVISGFLMREHGAQVVWIGRSAPDSARIRDKLAAFREQGLSPRYVQADVTDAASISAAISTIRAAGPIHGAMFSSLVFAFDDTLERVSEQGFRDILDVKLAGGLNFFRALQGEALDFLCYFSSAQAFAFSGATQFVSYAAAMTAADTLCRRLARESAFPVGIINWGFWRSSVENERLGANIGFMTDAEGSACFSRMVGLLRAGRAVQALALRPSDIVRTMMPGVDGEVRLAAPPLLQPSALRQPPQLAAPALARLVDSRNPPGLEGWMPRLLLAGLRTLGVLLPGRSWRREALQPDAGILPKYGRWLDEALAILTRSGLARLDEDLFSAPSELDRTVWQDWRAFRDTACANAAWRSNVLLLDACAEALPGILTGRATATDILFPGGSTERVSSVYSGTPLFDGLNDQLAEAVSFTLDALHSAAPGHLARIVEIGAGTGGTTRRVLPRLQRHAIGDYLFTDLSRSFLIRAEDEFGAAPWFRTALWNIEQPAAEAGIGEGVYDIAIATNVLHATRSIAATLRHAKSALRAGGVLFINEITHNDAYGTLTFGLLDGWWLYDDPGLRVPGSPLLSPGVWRAQLAEAGFTNVTFAAGAAGEAGYHVIMAESDGLLAAGKAGPAEGVARSAQSETRPSPPSPSLRPAADGSGLHRARAAIRAALCAAAKLAPSDIDDTTVLSDYGIDSILGIRFIGHVNDALGLSLNPAIVFEHATVERLARHAARLLPEQASDAQASAAPAARSETPPPPAAAAPKAADSLIAVIGMSGQFPDAADTGTFWRNLAAGHDAVRRLPEEYLAGRTPEMRAFADGGRLEDRDCFDPLFFAITPREAESMSPHQRLIMQEGWKALEDAAIDPRSLAGRQVGVFIGAEPSGYVHETFSGQSDALVASRLSYTLNLRGPALAVNTGCSSSASAIHLACESLRRGETELALAGGVCANLDTPGLLNLLGIGMLSESGRCRSFSDEADGTVMSEAAAVVVLKRLEDALRDGDPIHAVIAASGANQDGASNGITAPNGEAQEDLIRETYLRFSVDPDEISYVETHGTGTRLGDVVEANALTRAFAHFTARRGFCAVASAKSSVGHSSAAAGVTGLIAACMAIKHGLIPGLGHFTRVNPHIEQADTALSFSGGSRPWPAAARHPRTAALNSFGHSGTNVHIVVREAPEAQQRRGDAPASPVLVPISARTPGQLREAALRLAGALTPDQAGTPPSSVDDAVSLVRREVAALAGVAAGDVSAQDSLSDIGLTADQIVILRQRLGSLMNVAAGALPLSEEMTAATIATALTSIPSAATAEVPDLASVAMTLQTGRAALPERAVFLVSSCAELRAALEAFAAGACPPGCWQGRVDAASDLVSLFGDEEGIDESVQRWAQRGRLDKIAAAFARGLAVDWRALHGLPAYRAARRLHLPPYPFARERYRKPPQAALAVPPPLPEAGLPSALLHANRSDLTGARYVSRFSRADALLAEHCVGEEPVIPAATAIELAFAAAVAATGRAPQGLSLRHLTWPRAISLASADATLETLVAYAAAAPGAEPPLRIEIRNGGGELWFAAEGHWAKPLADSRPAPAPVVSGAAVITGENFYAAVAASGVNLGPRFRLVSAVHEAQRGRVAEIALPSGLMAELGQYVLHPCVIDAVLQTVMALEGPQQEPMLPFSVDRLDLHDCLHADRADGAALLAACAPSQSAGAFDITLFRRSGEAVLSLRGVAMRRAALAPPQPAAAARRPALTGSVLLAPVWERIPQEDAASGGAHVEGPMLLAGSCGPDTLAQLKALGITASAFAVMPGDTVEDLARRLRDIAPPERILWLAPADGVSVPDDPALVQAQRAALVPFYRFVKALTAAGLDARPISWTILTRGGAATAPGGLVNAPHASLHGFIGSLAKEMPEWRFRVLDLAMPPQDDPPLSEILCGPGSAGAEPAALRGGDWFVRRLAPLSVEPGGAGAAAGPLLEGGVTVVIGGAGGIGSAWSEAMIRRHGARIVWIGRRAEDEAIRASIRRLAEAGPAPVYVQADAADAASLRAAVARIRAAHGPIRGVVHSAIVLADHTAATMTEAQLIAALRPKVDASAAMAQAFAGEPLDFVLFFSSVQSFLKMPGQGNYAAGSCFADAFADALRAAWNCPVKVMDWGYWGNVGIVSSAAYRQRMEAAGMASIEPREAWDALDVLLGAPLGQMALMQAKAPLDFPALASGLSLRLAKGDASGSGVLAGLTPGLPQDGPEYDYVAAGGDFRMAVMEPFLRDIVVAQLRELGLSSCDAAPEQVPASYLRRWLWHTPALLDAVEVASAGSPPQLAAAWAAWDGAKPAWLAELSRRAQVTLVEAALRELPAILSGAKPATAVLLPDASLEMVEQVYTANLAAQYFNRVLANGLVALIGRLRERDPARRIRILEVGAGTGATSAVLLRALTTHGLAAHVEEYRYTDISHAFLAHAQDRFAAAAPYLRTSRLDIDRPLAPQGVEEGVYDIVIAANSIHTTRDIRRAVRNAKSALRRGGVLLLNEISGATLYGHLTFGLLEGWWLFDEPALRIPGCPGLSPAAWRQVLRQEGFSDPLFPASQHHALGLQIIMAESDGVIIQADAAALQPRRAPAAALTATPRAQARQAAPPMQDAESFARDMLTALVSDCTRIPLAEIDAARPYESYGIDSIVIIDLAKRLRNVLPDASTTLFFEHQSIAALAAHLARTRGGELAAAQAGAQPAPQPAAPPAASMAARPEARRDGVPAPVASAPHAVAIVGVAGRYPMSPTLEAFWDNLAEGRNCITEVPEARWNWRDYFDPVAGKPGAMSSRWGGFIDGIDRFDPLFFGISPLEAEGMNPQERLFLQIAWACVEEAGYTPEGLNAVGKVGVFAGVMNDTYHRGAKHWSVANRVSYHCNFQGPSLAVDTACSSSLTALHLALESLQCGSCRVALAGGVNLITNPLHSIGLSQLRVLSGDDRNKTFSAGADGFVDAEGVGAVLLRPLAEALAAGDHIHGVILGSAINAGGKVNGYTVPNPRAQAAVVAEALARAGVDPGSISYVEAHGTGTVLGDPIEISGLAAAFGDGASSCAIGSVKSNMGHAESAAGMAGLTKILLQLKHRTLVPSLHSQPLNPEISFAGTPFHVQTRREAWVPRAAGPGASAPPRRAGLSSFGAGGANAHVIIEEAPSAPAAPQAAARRLVVLSADTPEQLRQVAEGLLAVLSGDAPPPLADIAFTLLHGRVPRDHRLAIDAASVDALRSALQGYLAGSPVPGALVSGVARRTGAPDPEGVEAALASGDLMALAHLWVQGAVVDWNRLMPPGSARRASLPTYPFAAERCWAPDLPLPPQRRPARPALEPLRQQFAFTGEEAMLRDHRVGGEAVLPGVAYLGFAWRAITEAFAAPAVSLSDVVWIAPFRPDGEALAFELTPTAEGQGRFSFTSLRGAATVLHCAGTATWRPAAPEQKPAPRDLMELMSACRGRRILPDALQAAFRRMGVEYGPSHLALGAVDLGPGQAFAALAPAPDALPAPLDAGLLDSAFQACLCMIEGVVDDVTLRDAPLPFRLRRLEVFAPQGPFGFVHAARHAAPPAQAGGLDLDLDILGPAGEVALRFTGLSSRAPALPRPAADSGMEDTGLGGEATMDALMCGLVRQSLPDEKAILPFFKPWLAQTTDYLAQFPADGLSGPQLWERWKACRAGWLADPALAPRVALMEAALPAIPQVLTGRRKATDVLFPGGSLALVEPVYRGNPTADAFNGVLAEHVARFAATHASGGGLRILEIGAGTGGTTHHVLERLKPFEKAISEYCYTDRSHSFLQHGERQYGAGRGFFACRLLDIEKPAEEQGFAPGSYDLVIAANVLHATRDMRATMRNVHSLLRPDGLLAMNELSGNALYAHLSFGLLEGWWRYDDAALRMPGSPGLAPGSWAALLAEEGFTGVSFPAEDSHALGQQIILARNAASLAAADAGPVEDRLGAVEATIRAHVARSLKIAPERIENDRSFSDYGVDSILAVNLVNDIAEAVGAPLTTTVIFDYNTVERLARHVIETYPGSGSSAAVPDAAPAPLFDGRMRAVLQAFEEADLGPQETVLLLTGRPDVADLGERVARERGIDLIVAAPSPSMRGWLSQPRGCRGLALDGPEFGKRLLAFNQRRKVDHIICDLPDVAEDLSQILRDGGQWLDVG